MEYLMKKGINLIQELERDYEIGVELFKKHNISALDYFNFLDIHHNSHFSNINQDIIKHRLNDVYYFLTLDRDIRGE